MPELGRADSIGVAPDARGASFNDLSVLIDGEVARLDARDRGFAAIES